MKRQGKSERRDGSIEEDPEVVKHEVRDRMDLEEQRRERVERYARRVNVGVDRVTRTFPQLK